MGATRVTPEMGERTGGECDIWASPEGKLCECSHRLPVRPGRHLLVHRVLLSIGVGERYRLAHTTRVWYLRKLNATW